MLLDLVPQFCCLRSHRGEFVELCCQLLNLFLRRRDIDGLDWFGEISEYSNPTLVDFYKTTRNEISAFTVFTPHGQTSHGKQRIQPRMAWTNTKESI